MSDYVYLILFIQLNGRLHLQNTIECQSACPARFDELALGCTGQSYKTRFPSGDHRAETTKWLVPCVHDGWARNPMVPKWSQGPRSGMRRTMQNIMFQDFVFINFSTGPGLCA